MDEQAGLWLFLAAVVLVAVVGTAMWWHERSVLNDKVDGVARRLPLTWPDPVRRRYDRLSLEEKKAWWRRYDATMPWAVLMVFVTAGVVILTQALVLVLPCVLVLLALGLYGYSGGRLPRDEV